MRVEYIDPFVKAAYSVMCEFLGKERVSKREIYLKKEKEDVQTVMGLVAVIGFTGQAEGRILLDMEECTALDIANVINGKEFSEVDELVQATIQELANVFMGRAVTELHELGFIFDITPPAIFIGKQMRLASMQQEILIFPLETEFGLVNVNISIFDKLKESL